MYKIFNRDLAKIRYKVATEYYGIIQEKAAPLQYSNANKLQVNAVVNGLGPKFKIVLSLSNLSKFPLYNLTIVADFNSTLYSMSDVTKHIRCLIPKMEYSYIIMVSTLCNTTSEEVVKLIITSIGKRSPIANVMVQMPMSENFVENF